MGQARILVAVFVACVLIMSSASLADIPQVINYQGRLCDSLNSPVPDGNYDVTLTLYTDPTGTTQIWTCSEAAVPVVNGLFTCRLGVTCSLPDNLFANNASVWLGIAIDTGPVSSPLTQILSVPFAYHSLRADTADYAGSTVVGWTDAGDVVHLQQSTDSVGVGTSTPVAKLDVEGTINASRDYHIGGNRFASDSGNGNVFVGVHAGQNNAGISNTIVGYDAGVDNAGHNNTFVGRASGQTNTEGEGNTFVGGSSGSANTGGDNNTYLGYKAGISAVGSNNTFLGRAAGATSLGFGNVFIGMDAGYHASVNNRLYIANSSTATPLIFGNFETSQVGLGTTSPTASLHAVNASGTAIKGQSDATLENAIHGIATGSASSGVTGFASGLGGSGVSGFATGENGKGIFGSSSSDYSYAVYALAQGHAAYALYGEADSSFGRAVYGQALGSNGVGIYGIASAVDGYGMHAKSTASDGVALFAEANQDGGVAIEAHGGDGGYAGKFAGNVILVDRVGGETLLELGEGLDYAEGFNHAGDQKIDPGTVVVIDPENPGQLGVSSTPYDNKVAGIVAGANGLGSGVRLGGDRFDMDVALAGRVYCNVDATQASVEPGDLLTTSATSGHAMKATDYNLARGAILGKAMQGLKLGETGQILVLVTLQ